MQNSSPTIVVSTHISNINFLALTSSFEWGEFFPLNNEDKSAFVVSSFIEKMIENAGGVACVEVDEDFIECVWQTPSISENFAYATYATYMLQYGMFENSEQLLADSVYKGYGKYLAFLLTFINKCNYNKYVVEKDLFFLAGSAPRLGFVWLTLGLILVMNKRMKDSQMIFEHLLELHPNDISGLKYMALLTTNKQPKKAAEYSERLLKELDKLGVNPDIHDLVTCGFAFMKCGRNKDSKFQFERACGCEKPKMTLNQWLDFGCSISNVELKKRLMEP